jgi:glycosyltransferase involved in cell wall biosynthesis
MTYPIHVVSNGIRIEEFKENKKYRVNFRRFLSQQYNIPEDAVVIINVGLSWKKKGVKTFGEIAAKFPEYYFVWVGPISKNPEIDEVTKLDNVIFTGFYNDIREAYYGADLFLNTSWVENQGIPIIEAANYLLLLEIYPHLIGLFMNIPVIKLKLWQNFLMELARSSQIQILEKKSLKTLMRMQWNYMILKKLVRKS